jgi:hypothetical protein
VGQSATITAIEARSNALNLDLDDRGQLLMLNELGFRVEAVELYYTPHKTYAEKKKKESKKDSTL